MINLAINPAVPQIMWIDLNSAFATIEQQAHQSLRHHPVAVTNRITPQCCVITASYEAKRRGVKTGMRRPEALYRCPELIFIESDPPKYNHVYNQLYKIMSSYSPNCQMKSIDEGFIDLHNTNYDSLPAIIELGQTIKSRVQTEIGDHITINVGIGPNRFLAKMAAGLHKPDGLDVINSDNLRTIFKSLGLEDLTGIATRYGRRLRQTNINTPLDFLDSSADYLRRHVFHSIEAEYWYRRLRGYEVDDQHTNLSQIGRQWMLDKSSSDDNYLSGCLHYLAECVGVKLRYKNKFCRGVGVWLLYNNGEYWHRKYLSPTYFLDNTNIWKITDYIFRQRPAGTVRGIGVYLYKFNDATINQLSLINDNQKLTQLTHAIDNINSTYGHATIHSAHSHVGHGRIKQKIPFGSVDYFNLLTNS